MNDYVDPSTGLTLLRATAVVDEYIVGGATKSTGPVVPFRFNRTALRAEAIPTGWAGDIVATGVNNVGEVVGFGYVDAGKTQQAPFIFSDQLGFRNLNDLLPANSGWNLQVANGINDSGDVVGWGYQSGSSSSRAFRLRVSRRPLRALGKGRTRAPSASGSTVSSIGVVGSSWPSLDTRTPGR